MSKFKVIQGGKRKTSKGKGGFIPDYGEVGIPDKRRREILEEMRKNLDDRFK